MVTFCCIYAYLKQKRCGLDIVLFGGNMQCRQSNLTACIAFQQYGNNFIVSLLHGNGKRRKAILGGQTLVGAVGKQQTNDGIVIFLSGHVQWREAILRLSIYGG